MTTWRQRARAAADGSTVLRAVVVLSRGAVVAAGASAKQIAIPLRWALAATPPDAPIADARTLRTLVGDARIVQLSRAGTARMARWWNGADVTAFVTRLAADLNAQPLTARVRLAGVALAVALVTHAGVSRFELIVTRSPWLLGWVVVMALAVGLLAYPAAFAAAWANRKRFNLDAAAGRASTRNESEIG
jgi:hypothetical protein